MDSFGLTDMLRPSELIWRWINLPNVKPIKADNCNTTLKETGLKSPLLIFVRMYIVTTVLGQFDNIAQSLRTVVLFGFGNLTSRNVS